MLKLLMPAICLLMLSACENNTRTVKTAQKAPDIVKTNRYKVYYVSPFGNDVNNGLDIKRPKKTILSAIKLVKAGDTIYLRGGIYYPSQTLRIEGKNGTSENMINLFAYKNEKPVIDGSQFKVIDSDFSDNCIIRHKSAYWHFKNLEIRKAIAHGIQVFSKGAKGNILENLKVHDNGDSGVAIYSGVSDTSIINCDSYKNCDIKKKGENADGFAIKYSLGTGNKLIGCRAWGNSDDGFDFWDAKNVIILKNCWSYDNGYDLWGYGKAFRGNGSAFKLGKGNGQHLLTNCKAWHNGKTGYKSNGNSSGVIIKNCVSWDNKVNYILQGKDVVHSIENSISFDGKLDIRNINKQKNNTWNTKAPITRQSFKSLDDMKAKGPRNDDNSLPESDFLKLKQ